MSWLSQAVHGIENFVTGHHDVPDPRKFSTPSATTPMTSSNTVPGIPTAPTLPMANAPGGMPPGLPAGFNEQSFENQLRTDPDLAGVWQGIVNAGGDVWGVLKNVLPHNADGSVNWGAIGSDVSDVAGFLKNNSKTILDGLAAYSNYQRQQKSDQYAGQGLDLAKQNYAQNAPLRDQGRANMLNPSANTPDLSAIKTLATSGSGNPFAKALPMASIATKPGAAPAIGPSGPSGTPPGGAPGGPLATFPLGGIMHGAPSPTGAPQAAPQAPLTNPTPSGVALPLAPAAPTAQSNPTLAARKPLPMAPQSPALAAPPLASGLQPSRATLPFAYE